jgi:hypothetical protein
MANDGAVKMLILAHVVFVLDVELYDVWALLSINSLLKFLSHFGLILNILKDIELFNIKLFLIRVLNSCVDFTQMLYALKRKRYFFSC